MRLFELLLLLALLPPLLWPLFGRRRPGWLAALPLLALPLLLLHGLFEGTRWQMWPAYALTTLLLLNSLRQLYAAGWRLPADMPGHRLPGRLLALAGLLLLAVAAALPALLPVPKLPPVSGPYPVGTTSLHLVDNGREEIYTPESGDPREFMVQFWYPAAPTGRETAALFLPKLDIAGPVLAESFDLPAVMLDHVNLADLEIVNDPPLAEGGPFPVILFGHGLTGVRVQNTTMVRELASHGYIVAAIDHTYANALSIFPDDRVILYDACRLFTNCDSNYVDANPLVKQWAGDMRFLLDTMALWDETTSGILAGGADVTHVGVFGHSTGGGATLQFCLDDLRCAAGLGLDAWVLPVDERVLTAPPGQPFLFISTPHWLGDGNRARGEAIWRALPAPSYDLRLANSGHYDFSDMALISPLKTQLGFFGSIDGSYSLQLQTDIVLAFFDETIRGIDQPLLDDFSPYPELTARQR